VIADEPVIQIELAGAVRAPALEGAWEVVGALPELAAQNPISRNVAGTAVLFLRAGERLYGYRSLCPACERSLEGATLHGAEVSCPGCGGRYDALRAGRGLDLPHLHLEPVPLLEGEDGLVRVALPVAV
jgi:nitrite reductase/ring-hydroxylating ferredoxin subunit